MNAWFIGNKSTLIMIRVTGLNLVARKIFHVFLKKKVDKEWSGDRSKHNFTSDRRFTSISIIEMLADRVRKCVEVPLC